MNRRSFLLLAALSAAAATSSCATTGASPGRPPGSTARLRIPPLARPEVGADGVKRFALALQGDGRSEFRPGTTTATWGINGAYLGPTVRVSRGDRVRIAVTNRLAETSTLHLHGLHLPAEMDGGPHQMVEPGATWTPGWTVDQPATTSWYHPHLHGTTAQHVFRGLAGLFLVDDPDAPPLPHDYGVDDVPLIIQDKRFDGDGQFDESGVDTGTFGFLGDTILVNGTCDPFLEVGTELVRFRLLNASNARVYRIGFADDRPFQVVATEAGPLERPAATDRVKLSPGERAEIVVRFAAGEQVMLTSRGEEGQRANDIEEDDFDLLRIVAAARLSPAAPVPQLLGGVPATRPAPGARVRSFVLTGSEINGKDMDPARIDEVVPAGALEVWEVTNTTYAHNFHVHGAAFRILELDGAPPPPHHDGPKDTVFIPKEGTARLAVQFEGHTDPASPYMYHCHILRHEDKGMMGQFVVVEPGTEHQVPSVLSGAGHAHG